MSNKTIHELDSLSEIAQNDEMLIYDISAGADNPTKKTTVQNVLKSRKGTQLVVDNNTSWSGNIDITPDVENIILQTGSDRQLVFVLPTICLFDEANTFYNTDYNIWYDVTQQPQITASKTKLTSAFCAPDAYPVKVYFQYKY